MFFLAPIVVAIASGQMFDYKYHNLLIQSGAVHSSSVAHLARVQARFDAGRSNPQTLGAAAFIVDVNRHTVLRLREKFQRGVLSKPDRAEQLLLQATILKEGDRLLEEKGKK